MARTKLRVAIALSAAAIAVAGCGSSSSSSDNNSGSAGAEVPQSALSSAASFTAYVNDLIDNHTDGTSESVRVGDLTAPTNDTAEL